MRTARFNRPWGYYDSIDAAIASQVKRIVVNPGAALSLQMHHHRAEHWIVVRGTARVTRRRGDFSRLGKRINLYSARHPPPLENPGKVPLEMIEVQSGAYLARTTSSVTRITYGRSLERVSRRGG